jgi:malonyl CoA-acyl carrier protein transacylase
MTDFLYFLLPPAATASEPPVSGCGAVLLADCRSSAEAAPGSPSGYLSGDLSGGLAGGPAVLLDAAGFRTLALAGGIASGPVFVEYHPAADAVDAAASADFAAALAAAPAGSVVLATGDLDCALALAAHPALAAVALKPCEAAGLGSTEAAGVLFDNARRRLAEAGAPCPLMLWGGVATPEAAAAFLACGAAAVVVEHAHWLAAGIEITPELRQRLEHPKGETTACVPAPGGLQWRFFDKGNSRAVRRLRELSPAEAARAVSTESASLAASRLGPDELVPMGTDAAFAAAFAERFGTQAGPALAAFAAETLRLWDEAPKTFHRFLTGPAARLLGAGLPVIQGGMSWISDSPAFASAVAEAGALPTLAVGMRDAAAMDADFDSLAAAMQGRPYAMNVLVLEENPRRDEQLAWLRTRRPPFVAVAAGEPAFAGALRKDGLEIIYLAADAGLMRLALAAGVRFVVLEGCEAGGHVGRRTTLELAQEALVLRRREPGLFRDAFVALAGGVCGGPSALRAAILGADAVQMGTAYLATREIVSTGALSPLYQRQILEAGLGATRITGESVGLRVRALDTPKVRAICALERERSGGGLAEAEFRKELEALSVGSLHVASRGARKPGEAPLPPEVCADEGQFMSGAVAANVERAATLAEVHAAVASALVCLVPAPRPGQGAQSGQISAREGIPSDGQCAPSGPQATPVPTRERIAVTGMALANSLGDDVDEVVLASLSGKSGIGTVPGDRWNHSRQHTPGQVRQGTTYTDVGAFMRLDLPRKALGVSPQDYRTMSMSTKLTLFLARRAIKAAGLAGSLVPGQRVAVLTSQNSAEVASTVRGQLFNTYSGDLGEICWRAAGLTEEQRAAVEREFVAEGLAVDDTTLIGRLNCTASGHICNQFGFGGPSYSVGAACASSLIALYNAVLLMRAGVIDAAVVGGGEELITPVHYLEFSALRALAGVDARQRTPQEHSRPFDRDRDGFVLGEGGAVVVLERESLARRRGAPIHALITGVGACTNHQGIVESVAESQMVALNAACADAGYGLDEVDLVECHGTGTSQGDREEVRALGSMLPEGRPGQTVLSSFKSQIGHTLGASGVSSLIRGIGAMRRGLYPPTNNFENPDPAMGLEAAGFRILRRAEAWPRPEGRGRRMQVNAFGFGGACVVVHLEAPSDLADLPCELPRAEAAAKPAGARFLTASVDGRAYRLGVSGAAWPGVAEALRSGLAGGPAPSALARLGRKGIFLAAADEPAEPLAFVFSGQGAFYKGMGRDISRMHPAAAQAIDRLAACADYDLKALLFDTDEATLRDTRWQQPALFAFQFALASRLSELGVRPAAVAGHSLGEFSALCAAGVLSPEDAFRVVDMRARCMAKAAGLAEAPGAMAAVGLPVDVLQWKLAKHPGVVVTNYNAPKQVVVGGEEGAVRALVDELKSKGSQATMLKVSMAFHSPVMRVIRDEFAAFLEGVPFRAPAIPVMSNVLKGPFPDDPAAIRKVMVEHLETAVHWTQNVYYLWGELGVRRFVEIGPGAVLCGLIQDIEAEARTVRTASREGEEAVFSAALAELYSWGDLTPPAPPEELDLGLEAGPEGARPRRDARGPGASAGAPPAGSSGTGSSGAGSSGAACDADGILERTIRIIMDATGYERNEIEPDMDLRKDLAIRSSRLPVIMDTAEQAFGLTFRIEDFVGVQTVRQMAENIEALMASGGAAAQPGPEAQAAAAGGPAGTPPAETDGPPPVVRYEAGEAPLASGPPLDLASLAGKSALVLGPAVHPGLEGIGQALTAAHGLTVHTGRLDEAGGGHGPAACLVLALEAGSVGAQDVDDAILACFRQLKAFVASPQRKTCVLALRDAPHGAPERVVFEGALGMLLTLAQEYRALAWRALRVSAGVDMAMAVAESLAQTGPVERMVRAEGASVPRYVPAPAPACCAGGPALGRGDVALVSAGARGVTLRVLEELAPLGARFVLLGRSPAGEAEAAAVARLTELGAQAEYHPCDVSDPAQAAQAVREAVSAHGRVDAVIHGAGLLRDGFLSMMTEEDFEAVCRVKLGGLRNLADAARPHGLRLVSAFSSVAAWQGNMGQGNYCCANRAMASLAQGLHGGSVSARVLWLPPVAGVGMADGKDIREMMELKGLGQAYVHIDELAPMVAREIACPDCGGPSALIARHMPAANTVEPLRLPATEAEAGLALPVSGLAMLDAARLTGLAPAQALFTRRVSHARDPWLPEHRPYKDLEAPLFSAVMVVESFCEAAQALCPHLAPLGVRNMRFLDMLPCAPGQERDLRISAARAGGGNGFALVDAALSTEEFSPTGRALGRFTTHFEGSVLLGGPGLPLAPPAGFPLTGADAPDTAGGADAATVQRLYEEHTAQTGRYRVIEAVTGLGESAVSGGMRYRLSRDVADSEAPFKTPPYVLEALMQLALFHGLLRGRAAGGGAELLPVGIEAVHFARLCADGEALRLEARLREESPAMQLWDACAFDAAGAPVLTVQGLVMRALAARTDGK